MNPTYITLLGVDPGKTNAAYSVIRIKLNPFRFRVLANGMFKHPVNDLTGIEVVKRMNAFKREVRSLKRKYGISHVIAERFMTRGGQSMGTTIEVVTVMLTLLAHSGIPNTLLITAAQWKNQWNRKGDLKAFYKTLPIPEHPIDATGIGLYGVSQFFDVPCFSAIDTAKKLKYLNRQILESHKEPISDKKRNATKKGSCSKGRSAAQAPKARASKRGKKVS
jgi:Holliday junction resolvasome RuvABC endonuclease subunit